MTPERWRRASELFNSALDQPPSQVHEFLRKECGNDDELYMEVQRMLEAHRGSGLLDQRLWTPQELVSGPAFSTGQMVAGRYHIVRFLGRGGMGEVYEAEDLELKERVALKTLLPEIAGDTRMIARFKKEIQLSRKVSHPNVCRVFDLARHPVDGSSSGATVFLTMEFLAGETLAARLQREGRLSPEAALPLLDQMAEALEAAHHAGVIHRDFKPSNVMLVPGTEGWRAVVTDFGLARNYVPSNEDTATLSGNLMGTLDYMAPELLTGEPASVASDVYSLGTVAYKMVTGALPFPSDTPLASAILRSKQPAPSPRAAVPGIDAAWELTLLRVLDPDPSRRFSRAGEFVKALRGEAPSVTLPLPVVTRRKIAAAALAAVAIVGGVIGWQAWIRARNQPSGEALMLYRKGSDDIHAGAYFAATKALERAVSLAPHYGPAHARLAEAWVELDAMDKASREMLLARREDSSSLPETDRLQIEAVDLTITREYAAAVGKYEQMRKLAGPNEADLDVDLGRAYEKAGQRPKAIESYRRAAEGLAHSPAAWLRLAALYSRVSDVANSAEAFRQAEERYQLTSNLEGLTEVADQRGIAANSRGQLEEAAPYLRRALETARLAGNIQQEIRAKLQLSTNAYSSGDIALAERYAREALDTAHANQMEGLAIRGIIGLGAAYLGKRDFAGAEKNYQDALSLARRTGSDHLAALSLLSLASLHDQLKRPDDSVQEAQEALAFYKPNRYDKEALQCLTLIGRAQRYRGEYPAALDTSRRLLNLAEQLQDPLQMGFGHEAIGGLLYVQERYPEALEQYQRSLALYPDPEHIGYANLESGYTLWQLGRYAEAKANLDRADPTAERFPAMRLSLMQGRAEMTLSQNLYSEAATMARRALTFDAGQNPNSAAELKRILGLALIASGNRKEGLRNCEESLDAAGKRNDVAALLRSQLALLRARIETGDHQGSVKLFRDMEPELVSHPESGWRALALVAKTNRQYFEPARRALGELTRVWGDAAYRTYLTRPDVQELSRPLFQSNSATRQ